MRSLLRVASVAFFATAAGCSLITATDDLGAGPTALGDDAGRDAAIHPLQDASDVQSTPLDAYALDVGALPDAEPIDSAIDDAPPLSDGSVDAGPFTLVFADDFEGASLPRAWDFVTQNAGAVTLGGPLFLSGHSGLNVTSQSIGANGWSEATLVKRFPMPAPSTTAAYEFNVFIQQFDLKADVVLGALQIIDQAGGKYELQVDAALTLTGALGVLFSEYSFLQDGGALYLPHAASAPLKLGAWNRVRIELTQTQPPIARLFFDGAEVAQTVLSLPSAGSTLQLSLGLSFVRAPSNGWNLSYDDVLYEVR